MTFLKDIFAAIAAIFGLISRRSDLNNSPEMKKRAEAQSETDQDDQDIDDIKNRNVDSIRNNLS